MTRKALSYVIFKGTPSEYRTLHSWVERQLGKPMVCWECGDTTRSRYHWANISGEYRKDVADFKRLCVPCYAKLDRKTKAMCGAGHEMAGSNVGHKLKRGKMERYCKACNAAHQHAFRQRKQAA